MREIVSLIISNYRFSIGGEHHYGKLHVDTKYERVVGEDGAVNLVSRSGYGVERHPADGHELKRRIGAREAAYLNRKDGDSGFGFSPGDETIRFNDVESVIAAAIAVFPTLFDETDVLTYRKDPRGAAPEILVAPDHVREAIAPMKGRQEREEWLMANGYMIKDEIRKEDAA